MGAVGGDGQRASPPPHVAGGVAPNPKASAGAGVVYADAATGSDTTGDGSQHKP